MPGSMMPMRSARPLLPALTLSLLVLAGCSERPRAPVLRDDPVYQNDREGFRFLAPEGWEQQMRGELPPTRVTRERTLVDYRRTSGPTAASFRVSAIDLPATADLAAHLSTSPVLNIRKWRATGTPQETKVGSAAGTRYELAGRAEGEEMAQEVVAVRRGERVYLFSSLFPMRDTEVRQQLRQVVASVIWKQ
ncbi:MAG: hypothetical protein U0736_04115 [Gemmataceae bacterium]